jgi:putative aminopeptidase FrvX
MASRAVAERWLTQLTYLPTASGKEGAVVDWVTRWVTARADLRVSRDTGGNLLIVQKGRKRVPLLLAVAHMDHPAFVIGSVTGREAFFEFRGGVSEPYFRNAAVVVVDPGPVVSGRVLAYDPESATGQIRFNGQVAPGSIAMFKLRKPRPRKGRFYAPACDDLAGVAASLAALDRARAKPELRHFGVLLTRAEEVGLVGALHAARNQTIPLESRILSIETSRELFNAKIGDGPIIRTGDRSTVFDRELTNQISMAALAGRVKHQRRLMDGGGCEATAFGAFGYRATGLCLALGNWHNRGNLDQVEAGHGEAIPMLEEISLDDFHGLVDLLLVSAHAADQIDPLAARLDDLYEAQRHYLS